MLPIEDDPGYQEMMRQAHELAGELTTVYDKMRMVASEHLANIRIGDALREYEALRQKRDEIEEQYILILQSIGRLKANWS